MFPLTWLCPVTSLILQPLYYHIQIENFFSLPFFSDTFFYILNNNCVIPANIVALNNIVYGFIPIVNVWW